MLRSGQRTVQDFRDDATCLPLLYLVHNPNSQILSSFLIFYLSHAVHSGIELYVLITILFLLNIPNFKLSPTSKCLFWTLNFIVTLKERQTLKLHILVFSHVSGGKVSWLTTNNINQWLLFDRELSMMWNLLSKIYLAN